MTDYERGRADERAAIIELVDALEDADRLAWPEAAILLTHPDRTRQRQAKAALYAWRERAQKLIAKYRDHLEAGSCTPHP